MAITRAQQFKQMLQNGGRIGLARGGRRGDTGQASQSESRSFGGKDERPNMSQIAGPIENIKTRSGDIFASGDPTLDEKIDIKQKPRGLGLGNFALSLLSGATGNPLFSLIRKPDLSGPPQFAGLKSDNRFGGRDETGNRLLFPRMAQGPRTMDNVLTEEDEEKDPTMFRYLADGGRIEAQEGGIMPRLNQLGSGVSSAEQTLQDINQRLESAESSLGGSGGNQFSQVTLPETLIPMQRPSGPIGIRPDFEAVVDPSAKTQQLQQADPNNSLLGIFPSSRPENTMGPIAQIPATGGLGIPAAGYADGGNVVGGEYDFESARQMYGLGKLVKKVTRSVKKIAKSPVGKAALLYAAASLGTAGLGQFRTGTGIFSPTGFLKSRALPFLTGTKGVPQLGIKDTSGILGTAGKFSPFKTILGASTIAGLTADDEQDDTVQTANLGPGLTIPENQYRFFQEGGSTEKEPVAKKTMPLLDMGGMEKDYREDGGFVPIGRMEKADDVPARLSKNEFVFTADAVRNAGDGDVDKGAEVMYNMMKNLEAGGEVSEESQGLEGARRMFQTSQRLEEVL